MDRLQVFPNPARTAVQLRTTLEGPKIFQLWSVDGRSVARQENAEMSVTFNLEGMASGTYVVEMTGAGGTERKLLSVQ
jgi:heat shock protein HslJ